MGQSSTLTRHLAKGVAKRASKVAMRQAGKMILAKVVRIPKSPLTMAASYVEDGVIFVGGSKRKAKAASFVAYVVAGSPGGVPGMAGGFALWGLNEGLRRYRPTF